MKKLLIIALIAWSGFAIGQTTTYQLIEDNPNALPGSYITVEPLGLDGGSGGDINLYTGGTVFWSLTDQLKLEGVARYNVVQVGGNGTGFHLEAGGFLPFISKEVKKDVPVILKTTLYAAKIDDDKYVDETKYFKVKGTYLNQMGPRGGIYFKKSGFDFKDESSLTTETNYTLTGAYIGWEKLTQAFVKTKVGDNYKYGHGQTRIYADALIVPVRTVADDSLGDPDNNSIIGFRVGFQWNKNPYREKEKGLELNPVYTVEVGSRPISGFYAQMSFGLNIFNQ